MKKDKKVIVYIIILQIISISLFISAHFLQTFYYLTNEPLVEFDYVNATFFTAIFFQLFALAWYIYNLIGDD